jgi:hypothetical protein
MSVAMDRVLTVIVPSCERTSSDLGGGSRGWLTVEHAACVRRLAVRTAPTQPDLTRRTGGAMLA